MDSIRKKYIRILAERFNHTIHYYKDTLILNSKINHVKVCRRDTFGFYISYNLRGNDTDAIQVSEEDIYDVLLDIFYRKEKTRKIQPKKGILLSLEEWKNEEGVSFVNRQLTKLKAEIQAFSIEERDLGGNRYLAEYYKGIIILMDDICVAKSNIVVFE